MSTLTTEIETDEMNEADYERAIAEYQAKFDRISQQMQLDRAEIERLKGETQTRLDEIRATLEEMRSERCNYETTHRAD
ncbi:MAG: hypothetical protein M3347_10375 [Armatimonadota bacterium]|nr:hypothetical protein [Armatimonadota bacterium]